MRRPLLTSPEFPIILAPFILFAPVLFGGALFWGTPALQFHPWHVFAWETLKSGHLPLWNPLSGLGAPLIANYQSALFYPPNWLYFVLAAIGGTSAMAWGMGLLAAAHLSLAGVGMVRLTRKLGLGMVAQTVSGLAFGLSGYLVARAHFLSMNSALAWMPWILWAGYRLVMDSKVPKSSSEFLRVPAGKGKSWELMRTHGNSFVCLAFLIAMLLLAGHAQTAWYTLLLAGVWIIFWSWNLYPISNIEDRKSFIQILFLFSSSVVVAVALAAVQLIPTAELLSQSQRSGGADYDFVMTYSFWPWRLLGLVAPGLFGSPATGDYLGYGNFWEDAIYIGLLPFFLALRTFPYAIKAKKEFQAPDSQFPIPLIRFLWIIIAITFLLALGQNTPIFPFLYRYIPTFDLFQAPTRYMIWAAFALALLAGMGAETWTRPAGKKARARTMRGIVIAAAVFMAAFAAKWVAPDIAPSFIRATALAGAFGVGAGILGLYTPKSSEYLYSQELKAEKKPTPFPILDSRFSIPNPQWYTALILFLSFDLLLAGWGLNPDISLDFYRGEGVNAGQVREMVGEGRLFLPADDEYDLTFDRYLRFDTFHADFTHFRASLLPNLNLLDGISSANNFDPLRPARYVHWMDALETADEVQQQRMLAMMGVTAIERYAPISESGVKFEPFEGNPRFQWFPCAWSATDGENAWNLLFEHPPEFDRKLVILEGYKTNAQWVCGEAEEATIQVISETPNEIRLQVDADSSGWLFIADTWYPGWMAEVNGQEVPVYRADYLFRAVDIPVGGGEVVMRYRPKGFYVGMVMSLLAWIGFGVAWWRK